MKFLCFLVLTLGLLTTAPFAVEAKQKTTQKTTVEKQKHRDTKAKERASKDSSRVAEHKKKAAYDQKNREKTRTEKRSLSERRYDRKKEQARNDRLEKRRSSQKDEARSLAKRRAEKNSERFLSENGRALSRRDRQRLRREASLKRRSYVLSRRFEAKTRKVRNVASLDSIQPLAPKSIKTRAIQSTDVADNGSDQLAGKASWYGRDFHGGKTASGLRYDMYTFTAAHRTLPLGTVVKVTTLDEGKSVVVCVTDRGPYVRGRIIDLSYAAANQLGLEDKGIGDVNLEIICDKDGKPLKKKQAFFVQYRAQKGNEKAGPFKEFADACAMQEALRQAHPDATVILGSTR